MLNRVRNRNWERKGGVRLEDEAEVHTTSSSESVSTMSTMTLPSKIGFKKGSSSEREKERRKEERRKKEEKGIRRREEKKGRREEEVLK